MFQKQSGGLGGLLDLFKQKGLASIASTWPGGGKGLPLGINPTQLENVIGGALVKAIASKTGLGSGPIGGERLPVVVDIDSSDSPARLVRDAQVGRRAAAGRAIGFER